MSQPTRDSRGRFLPRGSQPPSATSSAAQSRNASPERVVRPTSSGSTRSMLGAMPGQEDTTIRVEIPVGISGEAGPSQPVADQEDPNTSRQTTTTVRNEGSDDETSDAPTFRPIAGIWTQRSRSPGGTTKSRVVTPVIRTTQLPAEPIIQFVTPAEPKAIPTPIPPQATTIIPKTQTPEVEEFTPEQEDMVAQVLRRALRPALVTIKATISQALDPEQLGVTQLEKVLKEVQDKQEVLQNNDITLGNFLKELDERGVKTHMCAYHAYQETKEIAKGLQQVEDHFRLLPDLLEQIKKQGKEQLAEIKELLPNLLDQIKKQGKEQLKEIKELQVTGEVLREIVTAIEDRLTKFTESHQDKERPQSATSDHSIHLNVFDQTPVRHSTKKNIPKEDLPTDDIPRGAKAEWPEPFEGKQKNRDAENYLMRTEVFFNDYPGAFTDDRKISTTLGNMKDGDVSKWAQPLLSKVLEGTPHPATKSWKAFKEAFLLAFGDPIKKEHAIQNIQKLVQTRSVQEYASDFRLLMDELDWNEEALPYRTGKWARTVKWATPVCSRLTL